MYIISTALTYIIMGCCAAGGIAYIVKSDSGLAQSFLSGIRVMGTIFLPCLGLMAAAPCLRVASVKLFGSLFAVLGIDISMGTALLVPGDLGGYGIILNQAASPEAAVAATITCVVAAPAIIFSVPLILTVIEKRDYPYAAMGIMSGFLAIPFCVLITCAIVVLTCPEVRTVFSATAPSDYTLHLEFSTVFICMLPLIVFCILLALLLRILPKLMVKVFIIFGKTALSAMTVIAVLSIIEYYTGLCSSLLGDMWLFDPIVADEADSFRAVELVGTIAMMLSGAFPLVYLIRRFFGSALKRLGKKLGLDDAGSAGLLAALADANALYPTIKDMKPESKVMTLAFNVCAGYALGTWIAYFTNFQPNMVIPVLAGQLGGGVVGMVICRILAIPQVRKMTREGSATS